MLKTLRQVHFYLGVFFAPTIIFFAFSGALQVFSLHENHDGKPGIPWITALAEVHKNQRVPNTWTGTESPAPSAQSPSSVKPRAVATQAEEDHDHDKAPSNPPREKASADASIGKTQKIAEPLARPAGESPRVASADARSAQQNPAPSGPPKRRPKSVPLKVFSFIMAMGLILSSLIGVYMAFKYSRGAGLIWGLLIAGSMLPAVLLYL